MKHLLTLGIILMIALSSCKTTNSAKNCYNFSERQIVTPDSTSGEYTVGIRN